MKERSLLITGGAGFIGANASAFFSEKGWHVTVLDNLSRPGSAENLRWLQSRYAVGFSRTDVRDAAGIEACIKGSDPEAVLHLAGQVAVTTSVENPRADFEVNALGTLNVLEAIRAAAPKTFFVNASTNKVYGRMEDLGIVERDGRYAYESMPNGVPETRPLDFHSPYGCSKGVADQYTVDYARIYGLNTVSLRQSCIYGPHQMGIEDQGWVAWFIIATLSGRPITIFGDGKQVRDVLHVQDLMECYEAAIRARERISGQVFNIGGGPDNTLSLLELLGLIERSTGREPEVRWDGWRPGDQPVFVCDLSKAQEMLGWRPRIDPPTGIKELIDWVRQHGPLHCN